MKKAVGFSLLIFSSVSFSQQRETGIPNFRVTTSLVEDHLAGRLGAAVQEFKVP